MKDSKRTIVVNMLDILTEAYVEIEKEYDKLSGQDITESDLYIKDALNQIDDALQSLLDADSKLNSNKI